MKPKHENLSFTFPVNIRYFVDHRAVGRSHWHEEIELQYVLDGEVQPTCNLQKFTLKRGDILFVNSNELHSGNIAPTSHQFYCFHISREFFSNHIGSEHIVFNNVVSDPDCATLLDEIIRCSRSPGYKGRLKIGQLLYEFLNIAAERHVKAVLSDSEFKKHFKRTDKFNDVVKFIEEHFEENLSVSDIAARFFMTPSHFAHFFKKRSGKSVIQYVNEVRIDRAKAYLEQEDLPVGEIALRSGFSDFNYFSRKFKQLTGMTPTEYKKQIQASP